MTMPIRKLLIKDHTYIPSRSNLHYPLVEVEFDPNNTPKRINALADTGYE